MTRPETHAGAEFVRVATFAMATRFEFVLIGAERARLRAVGEEALAEVHEAERELSRFDPASALSHAQREGAQRWVRITPGLCDCLATCLEVHGASAGAFDPTLAGDDGAASPSGVQANGPAEVAGLAGLELDRERCRLRLRTRELRLDLGAIGKGIALERAAAVLQEAGIGRAFLHGGTSTAIGLGAPGDDPDSAWVIALAGGAHGAELERVHLRDAALSVSCGAAAGKAGGSAHVRLASGGRAPSARRACVVTRRGFRDSLPPRAGLADAWSTALVAGASREGLPAELELIHYSDAPPELAESSAAPAPIHLTALSP